MKKFARITFLFAVIAMFTGIVSVGKVNVFANETQEELVEDLNGRLVTANEEEDANSWRYKDGERIESESENQISLFSLLSSSANASASKASGVDVSKYQGDIDWNKASSSIDFAIIRCGYGSNIESQDDPYFEANAAACEELGIPYGVYLYSYATNTTKAKSEAEHVIRMIGDHDPSLPVYLDLEDSSIINSCTNAQILKIATVFCETIEAAGYQAGIYANLSWWNTYLSDSTYDSWDRWVAQWGSSCTYNGDYTFWQYTSSGTVPGITGNVDCDYAMKDLPDVPDLSEPDELIYVNDQLYTGYYMDELGVMYKVANGKRALLKGTLSAGAKYYSYNDGTTVTIGSQTTFAMGQVYTGYYMDSSNRLYKVTNGVRSLLKGTLSAGAKYFSYNDGRTVSLANQTVYVSGKPYTGYYMDSSNRLYKVTNGVRSLLKGTLSAGAKYFSYNEGETLSIAKQTVYVSGKVYTGYYTDSGNRMYKVTKGTRSLLKGTLSTGAKYFSYNEGKTLTIAKKTVYVSGKVYTGYYMDNANRMYAVTKGTRSLLTATLKKGTAYYSYNNGETVTLGKSTTYAKGIVR